MAPKPWEALKDTFSSIFSRDLSKEAPNPASLSGAGIGRADAMGSAEYLEGGSTFNHAVEITDLNDFLEIGEHTDRKARYLEYDRMENIPEVSSALDTYCLSKDSIINTPRGDLTIEQLIKLYPNGENFDVYCYDEKNNSLTIGNAHSVRYTKTDLVYEIKLDNNDTIKCTGDHKFLLRNGTWIEAKKLKKDDRLMPCSKRKKGESGYKEIYTIDNGREDYKNNYEYSNHSVESVKCLNIYEDVYDLTTDVYHNFSCNGVIVHNSDETTVPDIEGKIFNISTPNQGVKEELDWLFDDLLQLETEDLWSWTRNVVKNGDLFLEIIIDADSPELGIQKISELPPETIYRIETVRGRLLEFQQSYLGPDYQAVISGIKEKASQADATVGHHPNQASVTTTGTNTTYASMSGSPRINNVIRFDPTQVVHIRIGMKRRGFYPYGVSVLYAGRRIAHLLKLMEDAMVIYRLCLTGESRVQTSSGYKYIKDLREGDEVFSYDQNGNIINSDVCYHVNNGVQSILKVRSKHVELRGTYTHPILIHDKQTGVVEYVDFQNLIPKTHQIINISRDDNTLIKIPRIFEEKWAKLSLNQKLNFRSKSYDNITEMMRQCDCSVDIGRIRQFLYSENKALKYEDAIAICNVFDLNTLNLDICNKNENNSERINVPEYVDEDFAKLFGFMLGDGSIFKYGISFASGIDEDLNNEYKSLLEKYFGKTIFCSDPRSNYECVGSYAVQNIVAAQIFASLGFISGHDKKRIPSWAFTASKEIRKSLIKGLVDADGSVRYTKTGLWTATIGLANKPLIEDAKELWSSCGLCSGHIIERDRRNEYHEITEGRLISGGLSWCLYVSDLNLPKYENILTVTPDGEEEVYDITVNNNLHNFIVNGTISHNTRAPERRIFYIDIGTLSPNKGEMVLERVRDKIKKKKIYNRQTGQIDERFNAWAADEDFFIPTRPESNTRIETLPGGCLSMDTKIPLLDGRILTLKDMEKEYKIGKQNWVYSCNPENGEIVPGIVSWAGVTHKQAKVMKLTFDNGETITCTPDHKFPILSKGRVRADELEIGESIIPLNTRKEKVCMSRKLHYKQVYDNNSKEWVFVHRMVANYFANNLINEWNFCEKYINEIKKTTHHIDYNRYNNNPENLLWMASKDHAIYHSHHINDPIIRQRMIEGNRRYLANISEEEREEKRLIYKKNAYKASMAMAQKLKEDPEFREEFKDICKKSQTKSKIDKPEMWKAISKKQSQRNITMWQDDNMRNHIISKQKIRFDSYLFDKAKQYMIESNGKTYETLSRINEDKDFILRFQELNTHIVRKSFDLSKGFTIIHLKKLVKSFGYKSIRELKQDLLLYNDKNINKQLMNKVSTFIPECESIDHLTDIVQNNTVFATKFKKLNKLKDIKNYDLEKMIRNHGYRDFQQLKKEIELYNHKITKIEYLEDEIEVGTLTIDANEQYHNFHTFAIDSIGFTFNSNLGEIDDTKYFREKLMVALKLPKNYLFQDEVSITRTSFATQDMRFARTIFRIQKIIANGIRQIAIRHLMLKGFSEEDIRKLKINFTAPSDWLELSRSELLTTRYNLAASIKGSSIYDDFTILTKILSHTKEEAKEIIDKKEQQTLREQEIQAQAQIFAQLATPDQNASGMPQTPPSGGAIPGLESLPGLEGTPELPPAEGETSPEMGEMLPEMGAQKQQKILAMPEQSKPKRFTDFADLEADEEEIDINYDE